MDEVEEAAVRRRRVRTGKAVRPSKNTEGSGTGAVVKPVKSSFTSDATKGTVPGPTGLVKLNPLTVLFGAKVCGVKSSLSQIKLTRLATVS